jgi:hypothetical protein
MSLLLRPYALPSKNRVVANVPAVDEPNEDGVKTKTSSSWPDTPDTEKFPLVDR